MFRQIALPSLLIVCLGPVRAHAQTPVPPAARQQIEHALDQQFQAANQHDTDLYLSTFVHSQELVFAVFGDVIHGYDALHKAQVQWWKNGKSDVVYTPRDPTEFRALAKDTVLVTQTLRSKRTGTDGKPAEKDFVVTTLWKNLPEGWRVIYAHESWAI